MLAFTLKIDNREHITTRMEEEIDELIISPNNSIGKKTEPCIEEVYAGYKVPVNFVTVS